MRRPLTALLAMGVGAGLLLGCAPSAEDRGGRSGHGCIADYRPGRDYFPAKSAVEHATNFSIRYEKTYQVLTVREPYPGGRPESYVLVRCGAPEPKLAGELAGAPRIEVPVRSVFAGSTTNLPLLVDLDRLGVLTGVAEADRVSTPQVRARVEAGKAVEFAPAGTVIAARPDVLMSGGTEDPAYRTLRRAGIPVVPTAEWREDTPLGRAEWIKVMAALTGTERRAAAVFERIEAAYRRTAARAAEAGEPTPVLAGKMFQGEWYVPGGDSYRTQLIRDAGGTHPWADTPKHGALTVGFEDVLVEAGDAKVWITDMPWRTLAEGRRADPRYAELAAFRDDKVWSNTPPEPGTGIDYWERGVTRPDLVLADYLAMLHPELMPEHRFTFFRRIPRS
ncbi:MAG: ABC transporter substrate-binding protein [Streptosporangiales bacterium]|nr:ABC transporter substrate-binding protein [Streptosporangiales bacterium]